MEFFPGMFFIWIWAGGSFIPREKSGSRHAPSGRFCLARGLRGGLTPGVTSCDRPALHPRDRRAVMIRWVDYITAAPADIVTIRSS